MNHAPTLRVRLLVILSTIAGCTAATPAQPAGDASEQPDAAEAAPDATTPDAPPLVIMNPVQENCADPGVLRDGNRWYMTCTGGSGGNLYPIYESTDLLTWQRVSWIFPAGAGPTWASGNYWAPELHKIGNKYVAYFSAKNGQFNAVGVASSATVLGPYTDRGTALVPRSASTIDAHVSIGLDGVPYLYFKLEGAPDSIWGHSLQPDGLALTPGPSTRLLQATTAWEGNVVEAPWLYVAGGTYYMFYSGAAYCNSSYAVGVARATSPLGPFTKKSTPVLDSGAKWVGPGHNAATSGPDGLDYMVYHAYRLSEGTPACGTSSGDNNKRHSLIDRIVVENGWPRVISNL